MQFLYEIRKLLLVIKNLKINSFVDCGNLTGNDYKNF